MITDVMGFPLVFIYGGILVEEIQSRKNYFDMTPDERAMYNGAFICVKKEMWYILLDGSAHQISLDSVPPEVQLLASLAE